MENTSYVGLSYQMALQKKMDLVSNNIANVDTSGYKSSHISFLEHISKPRNDKPLSMVLDYGNYKNYEQGAFQDTGNPLDVALEGPGFFAIQTAEGEMYSRNGTFSINALGQIVTSNGNIVLDAANKPIVVPQEAQDLTITRDGMVVSSVGELGRFKIVDFANPQQLRPVGNTLYESTQPGRPDPTTRVNQFMVERSNVNPITEMTDMIEVLRKYQSVARMLQNDHDLQRNMIQQLSRI